MKGQYGDHLRASEVRDVLVMYMKKQGWDQDKDKSIDKAKSADQEKEKDSVDDVSQTKSSVSSSLVSEVSTGVSGLSVHDRSCVCIPPDDGLYSLALAIEKNATTTTTSVTTNTSTSSSSGSGSSGSGCVAGPTSTSTSSSSLISPPPPPSTSSLDELTVYEDDDDGEGEGGDVGSRGGGTVGGVWMPAVGGSGAWSGSSGVRSGIATSGSGSGSSNSSGVGGFQRAANGQGPALLSIVAGENNNRPGMRGSSSVGGWGVDKGTIWRPTSLPSANPTPVSKTGVSAGGKNNNKSDKQKTTTSSSATTKSSSSASSSSPSIAMAITVRKEDLMKTLLKKFTPYFAIVGPNGQAQISSGRLPTIQVAVEARMGNKVVTHIRGLELFGVDVVGLAKDCQKRFACAATTGPVVEKGGNVC